MTTPSPSPKDTHFAKRVLNRIADEQLVPRARWEFVFQNYFFWTLGAVAVVLGAFAFSAMLFEVENVDWRLGLVTHESFLAFFFDAAPFLWVGALALFVLIGYVNVRRTNHGYRYSLGVITLGAILTSLALGTALYACGLGGVLDDVEVPFHQPILITEHTWWLAPEKGLLGGSVVSVNQDDDSFVLRDFDGALWRVASEDLRTPDLTVVARGGVVRVVGVPSTATSSIFHACFVLPWEQYGAFLSAPQPPFFGVASSSERNPSVPRSKVCRDIRPYQQLHALDSTGF